MARERKALPWGTGVDRASGAMVVDEDQFSDLRNVYLYNGRAELRKGHARTLLFPAGDDVIGIFPIRAQGLSGALVYKALDRTVSLYALDSTGTTASFVATIWTLDALATLPPSVIADDSYNKLIIAHDEPLYGLRQPTYVFSPADGTALPLLADFARTGTPQPVKFRGVIRHLNYLVGWGYGTSVDEDRPETLRISVPGEPTNFVPEHYFLAGTQGDPIVGCGYCNGNLAVMKTADSYKLIGFDRATFGIRPLDPAFGLLASRLHVSVNDEFHFWSLDGPRSTNGESSNDMGAPLWLDGPQPDPIATNTPKEKGFAYYDPTNREIVYVFGQWAYVLHIRDGQRRWSYRQYGRPLVCAGRVYLGSGIVLAITAHPEPGVIDATDPSFVGTDVLPKLFVRWTVVGGTVTNEKCEVWTKAVGGTWARRGTFNANALSGTVSVPSFLQSQSVALRFTQSGVAAAAYSNTADPSLWPAVSRATKITSGGIVQYALGGWWRYTTGLQGFHMAHKGPGDGGGDPGATITFRLEKQLNGAGAFAAVTVSTSIVDAANITLPDTDAGLAYVFQMRAEGPAAIGPWYTTPLLTVVPAPPTNLVVGPTSIPGGPNTGADVHNVTFDAAPTLNGVPQADGPYQVRGRHRDVTGGVNTGLYGAMSDAPVGVHAVSVTIPGYNPSAGVGRVAEVQARTIIDGNVSAWVQVNVTEA